MADTDERAAVAERRGAGRRAGCERSLPERHRRRDQRRGRRGDGGGPCGPAHRDRVDPRDVPGRRDRGRRGGRAQDGPRDGRRVGDRPDRRHQQLRPRHPRLGTAVAAVVDGEPVAAATVAPALGDVYTADTDGAYRNGESMCVSDVSNPRRATVDPTLWWDFDSRDEYAAACEAIVRRFSDLRRFGAAQIVLPTVAAGGLRGPSRTCGRTRGTPSPACSWFGRPGKATDIEGNRWRHDSTGLVVSNGNLHDEVLDAARAIEDSTEGTTSLRGIGSDAHADGGVPRSRRTARAPW